MQPQKFCQSCTMPIDDIINRGTEKDGLKSETYCKFCYQNGKFTDPGMTLERMKEISLTEMNKKNLPANIIQISLAMLSGLKRWKTTTAEKM